MRCTRVAWWGLVAAAVLVGGCSAAAVAPDGGADAGGGLTCTDHFAIGPSCGDGVCEVTETCLTCTADCGCCGDAGP